SSTCGSDNGSACVNPIGGCSPYSIIWDDPNTTIGFCAFNLFTGVYNVTITDCNGCIMTTPVVVNDIPGPAIDSIVTTDVTCNGDSNGTASSYITAGTFPFTYIWTDSLGDTIGPNSSIIFGLSGGNFTFSVQDANGCMSTQSFSVNEPASLTSAFVSQTNITCNGYCDGSLTVLAGGGTPPYTYVWTDGCTGSTSCTLCAGTMDVWVTDANGCSNISSANITEPPLLTFTATTVASCGLSNGSACVTATGGVLPYVITWNDSATTVGPCIDSVYCGAYNPILVDGNGCFYSNPVSIPCGTSTSIDSLVTTDISCYEDSDGVATVVMQSSCTPLSYLWSDQQAQTNATATGLAPGTYVIIVTDTLGNVDSGSVIIGEPDPIASVITAQFNTSCNGLCDGSATVMTGGGTLPYTYVWNNGCITSTCTGLCAASYSVTVSDLKGCSSTVSVIITEPDLLLISDSVIDVSCYGGSDGAIYISVEGGTPFYAYLWDPIIGPPFNLTAQTYCVTVTDINGCTESSCIMVDEPSSLLVVATVDDTIVCVGSSTQVSAPTTGGTGSYTYIWNTGITNSSFITSPTSDTTFSVTVTDDNGCAANASVNIISDNCLLITEAENSLTPILIFPNPNNGEFTIKFSVVQKQNFKILLFDISGQLIFKETRSDFSGLYKKTFYLENSAPGVYLIRVEMGDEVINKNIILE
ncbi:MAG: hypothetical protein COB85_09645, partial [Bacteroidetes bacterium]